MKLIRNIRLYDFEQYMDSAFVAFDEQITKVASMSEYSDYKQVCQEECSKKDIVLEEIDGKGALLMPGLVLGHTHIYSTFARGWITPFDPHSFQDILDQLWWKLDRALGSDEIYYSGVASAYNYLKHGVTTVIDHHASGQMIRGSLQTLKEAVVDDMGLRGIFCFETSDRFDVNECIEENVMFYEAMNRINAKGSKDASGLLGLHASFSLSDESLQKLAQTPAILPIHVHVAESIEDVQWTKEHCGISVLERFDKYGLLRENSLYVHGVHLGKEDFTLMKQSKGYLAFNPSSNMNNGVGLPPIDQAMAAEIPWIVGNDGLGAGLARDLQTMAFSSHLQSSKHFTLEALRQSMITSYDYASNQLGCQLGRLQAGYEADFMLLPYETITPMTKDNAFGHFVFGIAEQLHPKEVWIKGNHRMSNYETTDDKSEDLKKAKACAKELWSKLQ